MFFYFGDLIDDELEDIRLGRGMRFLDLKDLLLVENLVGIREIVN